jgi:integrase
MKGARTKLETVEYTVADMARDYEKSTAFADLAKKSQAVYGSALKRIVDLLGEYPVEDVKRSDIQGMLDNDIEGVGAQNMFIAVLGVVYKWGRANEKTSLKPTEGFSKRKGGEHEPWPDHVVEAALTSKDAKVRLAVHLLYFTGQRINDVLSMRWSDIRDDMIEVTQQKTGKTVWIPFLNELRAELAGTPKKGLTIIANDRGQRRTDNTVRDELQAFTRKHGAETVPHGLRKNAVNALLEAGCTVAETASITGQSYKVVEHYAKRINQRKMAKAAILKLETNRTAMREKA